MWLVILALHRPCGLNTEDVMQGACRPKLHAANAVGALPILTTTRIQYAIHSLWIRNRWIQLAFHFSPRSWYIPVCCFSSLYLITMPSINETQTILSTYLMANVCLWFQLLLNFGRKLPFLPSVAFGRLHRPIVSKRSDAYFVVCVNVQFLRKKTASQIYKENN